MSSRRALLAARTSSHPASSSGMPAAASPTEVSPWVSSLPSCSLFVLISSSIQPVMPVSVLGASSAFGRGLFGLNRTISGVRVTLYHLHTTSPSFAPSSALPPSS